MRQRWAPPPSSGLSGSRVVVETRPPPFNDFTRPRRRFCGMRVGRDVAVHRPFGPWLILPDVCPPGGVWAHCAGERRLHDNAMRGVGWFNGRTEGGSRIDSIGGDWRQRNACVHLYTCTNAPRAAYTYGMRELRLEKKKQQQHGEGGEAHVRGHHQEQSSVRRKAAVRGRRRRRRRSGRRHVGPCRARRVCQCRHFCQDPSGLIKSSRF